MYNNPNEIMAEISKQMILQGTTQKELAAKLNSSQQSISKTFKDVNPRFSTLCNICDALNLKIEIKKDDAN